MPFTYVGARMPVANKSLYICYKSVKHGKQYQTAV